VAEDFYSVDEAARILRLTPGRIPRGQASEGSLAAEETLQPALR
jgi:hypothetical protein